nr:WD repeat-containing protein 75 [Leptinotarsa decemlineata]
MEVAVNFKGGGSLVKLPPVFSRDGESVFVCSKNAILEYNTRTGKLSFEYKGFIDDIVGFNCHFYESHHCLTACCRNGTVLSWKTMTHFKISEKKLPISQVKTFNIISTVDEDYKAIISYKKNQFIRFASVNIKEKSFRDYKFAIKPKIKYFIGLSSKYFSVAQESDLYFIKLSGGRELSRYSMQATRTFTCLACHQFEEVVLTGDSTGRVLVWQNIFTREKTQSVFHWHTLPVQTVSFSASGSYFYSGGSECVLVKWQLENVNDRKFLPRLPAEVQHVAVANDNLYVAVATNDNAIRILDPTMKQITLIQHLVLGKHYEAGIVYDPRTQALIMNGNQGQIQFYSPDDMSLMFNIDIVDQNKITNERECVMVNTEITKFAISKTGLWLANIEERRDMEYHKEIRLKFWKFDESKQMIQNSLPICVTFLLDNFNQIFQGRSPPTVDYYSSCQVSQDVRAHCLNGTIYYHFFNSFSVNNIGILIHPSHKETIKQIQFGNGNQCHLLVSASENQLSVWNILTLSMVWTVPIKTSLLIADRLSENMGIICMDKSGMFGFYSITHFPESVIVVIRKICLFQELYCVSSVTNYIMIDNVVPDDTSMFSMAIPTNKLSLVQPVTPNKHVFEKDVGHKTIKKYLEGPIHTIAPIRFSCYSLLKSLAVQK